MNILDKIVRDKREEVIHKKTVVPRKQLETSVLFNRKPNSLASALRHGEFGIIAEHKRRSPSKAVINQKLSVTEVALGYERAGISGMSVLTDGKYFGGSLDDLLLARAVVKMPLLRKEFIIDEYQILEAKAHGADAILLIAAILSEQEIRTYSTLAKSLGLDVLLEIHNDKELQKSLCPTVDMLGVNNRNLKTFEVSIHTSKVLSQHIPDDFVKVSESGIGSIEAIQELKKYGFQGFLMGEYFMKTENPGKSALTFINQLS